MKSTAARFFSLSLAVLLASCAFAIPKLPSVKLTLVDKGAPKATIVIAKQPTRAAQLASYELQWHVQKITGALLPIVKDDAKVKGIRILVGESAATKALGLANDQFKLQEYLIRFKKDTLILMGHDKADFGKVSYLDDWFDAPNWAELLDSKQKTQCYQTLPGFFDERGTCDAVYDFLERYCDVRWYRPGDIGLVYTPTKTLTVTGNELRRTPDFRYVDPGLYSTNGIYYDGHNYERNSGLWPNDGIHYPYANKYARAVDEISFPELTAKYVKPTRMAFQYHESRRREGNLFLLRSRTGGEPYNANHSFDGYYDRYWQKNPANPDIFEVEHPDWFAQGYTGKPPQMCYTNPDFIKQVIQDARDYFDGKGLKPGAKAFGDFFALVPMDNGDYCKCQACRALYNKAEANNPQFNNGKWSNYIFSFVNEVAKEVRKTHPDKYIATLAYAEYAYYPTNIKMEPNIAVQTCLHIRNWWSPAMKANDEKVLREWAGNEKTRPIYLWLYYTFPQELSLSGNWYCFPGFFAHTAARQIKEFKQSGVRGVFYNGLPQDIDMYVTLKMFDDSSVDIDQVLDEYFKRYFGKAGEPLHKFYDKVEEIFSNPANYPDAIRLGASHYHQTEELAWGSLGTEARMAELATLIQQAKDAPGSEMEKRRVAVFVTEIWEYMLAGRQQYVDKQAKPTPEAMPAPVHVPLLAEGVDGDSTKVDWTKSVDIGAWKRYYGQPTTEELSTRLAHDGKYLYVKLEHKVDPKMLNPKDEVYAGDDWELFIARQRAQPYRQMGINSNGKIVAHGIGGSMEWKSGATAVSETNQPDRWSVTLALPLADLLTGGVKPGETIYMNFFRVDRTSWPMAVYAWSPSFGSPHNINRLGEIILDK